MVIEKLKLSHRNYDFKQVNMDIINDVYEMMKKNTYFYEKCEETCSLQYCIEDITNVPPNIKIENKEYYAFYEDKQIVGVIDYITGYPTQDCLFIGLFMLDVKYHKQNVGATIIQSLLAIAKEEGFKEVRLMCYKNNEVGATFWRKMGFVSIETFQRENDSRQLYRMVQAL